MDAFCFAFFWTFQAVLMLRTAVSELSLFPALNSTKIPHSFLHLLLSLQGYLGPLLCSVVGVGIPLASIPWPPLSFHHSSVNSSAFGTLLAVSISVISVFVCISMPSSTQEAEAADSGVKASRARLYQGKSKDKAEWSKDKFPGIGGMT